MHITTRQNLFLRHNELSPSRPSIWLIHGFADSGLAYKEVFHSSLNTAFNLYVVDMPGFGVSPYQPEYPSLQAQAGLLAGIIREETQGQPSVNLVAHSLGGLIGTWLCQKLEDRIDYYFSIEGNLTEADSYFSSKPLAFDTAEEFTDSFYVEMFDMAKAEERYKRYYSSLRFANPEALRMWGLTSQAHIKGNQCGAEFIALKNRKLYIWGDVDTPQQTQDFIQENQLLNRLFAGVGHWHMLENPVELYKEIGERIEGNQ